MSNRGMQFVGHTQSRFTHGKRRQPSLAALGNVGLLICVVSIGALTAPADAAAPDFDREIRPILSDKCFHCHGPDAEARQADLRLDSRDDALAIAIVPGNPDESELVARITSDDESLRMPPPETGLALSAEDKDKLQQWIAAGAPYAEHWSFRALPERVEVPRVADEGWPRSQFDNFVLARLEAEKLDPAPRAEPLRLLRRMTLDLTGLPPTVEEIEAFRDAAAGDLDAALAAAADRLLASPAYGEHMALAWLDAARYADSYGYQSDQLNAQWPYRDWVVRAFNENLPYDDFIVWQLAGDLLENPTRDQVLATAFNRMHRLTNEGGSIAEEWLAEIAADRVQTMGSAMLGLTLECARCHDHKFDPIPTRDYYSLTAFFNSIDENGLYDNPAKTPSPSLLLPTEEQAAKLAAARVHVEKLEAARQNAVIEGETRFQAWLEERTAALKEGANSAPRNPWRSEDDEAGDLLGHFTFEGPLDKILNKAPGKTTAGHAAQLKHATPNAEALQFDGDHALTFPELLKIDRWTPFTIDFWIKDQAANPLPVVVAHRTAGTDVGYNGFDLMLTGGVLEARLYRVWPGNAIGVRAKEPLKSNARQHLAVTYDGSSRAAGLRIFLDGRELPTTTLRDNIHKKASVVLFGDGQFTFGARFRDRGFRDGQIDDFRAYRRNLTSVEVQWLHDHEYAQQIADNPRRHEAELREFYFAAVDKQARELDEALAVAREEFVAAEEAIHEVSVMREFPQERPTYVLPRGAYDAPKTSENRVTRGVFQEILPPFPADAPRNRLGLAQWMTDGNHPLTARVAVNRLWANFFGRGLVETADNFGRQGAAPSHPELLDWLARDFVAHDWDLKRLCRQIVLSATYQQDSRASAELRDRDPENLLLARGPSRRLSAEQIRDLALASSDLLVRHLGGPPVSPYQPGADLWRESNSMSPAYQQSTGKGLHRRSIYSVWKRTAPLPNMMAFDAATREVCTITRGRTNTPLQSLVLLNDIQFVEACRGLAVSIAGKRGSASEKIAEGFLRLAGRDPDAEELELLEAIFEEQRSLFEEEAVQNPEKFLAIGEAARDVKLPPAELAALAVTCQAILSLDATIYER